MEPARPTWSSTPQSPAEGFAASPPLLPFSRRTPHLTARTRQDLRLSRTVIGCPYGARLRPDEPYVDRFACDWHRLVAATPRTGVSRRRNHGPGRTPWTDASRSFGRTKARGPKVGRAETPGRPEIAGAWRPRWRPRPRADRPPRAPAGPRARWPRW